MILSGASSSAVRERYRIIGMSTISPLRTSFKDWVTPTLPTTFSLSALARTMVLHVAQGAVHQLGPSTIPSKPHWKTRRHTGKRSWSVRCAPGDILSLELAAHTLYQNVTLSPFTDEYWQILYTDGTRKSELPQEWKAEMAPYRQKSASLLSWNVNEQPGRTILRNVVEESPEYHEGKPVSHILLPSLILLQSQTPV